MWHLIAENGLWFILLALLLVGSALTSGIETAIFSITSEDRVQLERRNNIFARSVLQLYADRDRLIVSILTLNNTINISYFAVIHRLTYIFAPAMEANGWLQKEQAWFLVQFVGLQMLLVFGEVAPKVIASGRYLVFAETVVLPFTAIHRFFVLIGLNQLLQTVTRRIENWLPGGPGGPDHGMGVDEIREAVSRTAGLSHEDKQRMRNLFSLSYLKVSAILVPRVDVLFAKSGMSIEQALDVALLQAVRILPVKGETSDDIRGVITIHDMLFFKDKSRPVEDILRPCMFFPEVATVESFIVALRRTNANFAVIVDEYGAASGVASLDDALDLVMGEFEDGGVPALGGWQEVHGRLRIDGSCPLHNFRARLEGRAELADLDWSQMDLPDIETVGGFVQHQTGIAPEAGQAVFWQNLVFRVISVSSNRIRLIEVRLPGASVSGRYKSQAMTQAGGRA